jgi:hypothetical protein
MAKVLGLRVENFLGLKFLDIRPNEKWQPIKGLNGQGKSSAIRAIRWGLGGPDYAPEKVIHNGADEAEVQIDLGEFVATRRKTLEGTATLTITGKVGGKKKTFAKPAAMLNELLGGGVVAFDPTSFAAMKPADQAEMLRKIVGVDTRELDAEAEAVYAERTAVNRDLKALQAQVDAFIIPDEVPDSEPDVDLSALVAEHAEATKIIGRNTRLRSEAHEIERSLVTLRAERDRLAAALAEVDAKLSAAVARSEKAAPILKELADPDISRIAEQMKAAQSENAAKALRRQARANWLRIVNDKDVKEQALADAERIAASHTSRLQEIERAKKEKLEGVKFPMPGLTVVGNTVSYNGNPVADASKSERIRIGMAIAAALNPGLDVLLLEGGESLDSVQMSELQKWSDEQGLQVFIEIVGDWEPGAIEIENGREKKRS